MAFDPCGGRAAIGAVENKYVIKTCDGGSPLAVEVNRDLENYLKVVLYAYPLLETVEEDYREHIKNKALLSYRSDKTAEELAFYIAEEIVCKNRLVWLKTAVDGVLKKLSDEERTLVAIRYFGKRRRNPKTTEKETGSLWSESKYFRVQRRLSEKVGAMLRSAGVTKSVFEREFAGMELFARVSRFVENGGEEFVSSREKKWLQGGALR